MYAEIRSDVVLVVVIVVVGVVVAAAIAAEAGVDDVLAEATPEKKLARIRHEQNDGRLVAMCGDGANDAAAHIAWMADNCPNTKIVLGGYSQGAAVVDALAAVPVPGLGFDAPLPGNAPEHIAGLVTFGNPAGKFGMSLANSPVWAGRAIDLCNAGDPVCNLGIFDATDVEAHRAYAGGPAYQAAGFIAGLL